MNCNHFPSTLNHRIIFAAAWKAAKQTVQEGIWAVTKHTCSKCWGFFFNSDGKLSGWFSRRYLRLFKTKGQTGNKETMTRQETQQTVIPVNPPRLKATTTGWTTKPFVPIAKPTEVDSKEETLWNVCKRRRVTAIGRGENTAIKWH